MPEYHISKKNTPYGHEGIVRFTRRGDGDLSLDVRGFPSLEPGVAYLDLSREEATKIRNYLDNWLEATK